MRFNISVLVLVVTAVGVGCGVKRQAPLTLPAETNEVYRYRVAVLEVPPEGMAQVMVTYYQKGHRSKPQRLEPRPGHINEYMVDLPIDGQAVEFEVGIGGCDDFVEQYCGKVSIASNNPSYYLERKNLMNEVPPVVRSVMIPAGKTAKCLQGKVEWVEHGPWFPVQCRYEPYKPVPMEHF
jgi:hypothetical protein